MRKVGRLATIALLTALCALSGCGKTSKYTTDDINSVSISCGHMDYSHSYSFYLQKEENGWLLSADYASNTGQPHTTFEACSVTEEDAKELMDVVKEQDVIAKLQRYKKPIIKVQVSDESTYYTSILFADEKQLAAATHISDDLVNAFYRLAEKYSGTAPKTDDSEQLADKEGSF